MQKEWEIWNRPGPTHSVESKPRLDQPNHSQPSGAWAGGQCYINQGSPEKQNQLDIHRDVDICISAGSYGKESAYNAAGLSLIPWSERPPGEGNGNPL